MTNNVSLRLKDPGHSLYTAGSIVLTDHVSYTVVDFDAVDPHFVDNIASAVQGGIIEAQGLTANQVTAAAKASKYGTSGGAVDAAVVHLAGTETITGTKTLTAAVITRLNNTTATTVGAAGAGAALPVTPTGYILINIGGVASKIPYYAP